MPEKKLALVTGASSGIGFELARCAAEDGCDLLICSNEPELQAAAARLRDGGASVIAVEADLSTRHGVAELWDEVGHMEFDYLLANAGRGLGHAFVEQDWEAIAEVIDLNVKGTTALLHRALPPMIARGGGRVLITGSVAGFMPGSYQAVYNATKAYVDSLSYALRDELKDTGVTVTCLMPGPTETEFFERADMEETPVGEKDKDDPAMVARKGYQAMKSGSSGVTTGFMNKVQSTFAGLLPDTVVARMHRRLAEPEEG